LHGVEIVVAASAGDGFVRHMQNWGAQVLLTGESDPQVALQKILKGEALPETRFDITTTLCKLRDLFSSH
jgi:predicted Fe-Mo cluster-binding NifX family protein